jgi:hypothetical protein
MRKRVIKNVKWFVVYGDLILRLSNGAVPAQAIGLPVLPPPIIKGINPITQKKAIIAKLINNSPDKLLFTEKQMDQLYDLAVKCQINSMTKE